MSEWADDLADLRPSAPAFDRLRLAILELRQRLEEHANLTPSVALADSKLEAAERLILAELGDGKPHEASTVLECCEQTGISRRTAQRAAQRLGVARQKTGAPGGCQQWLWQFASAQLADNGSVLAARTMSA